MTGSLKMAKLDFFTMKSQLFGYLSLVFIVFIFGYMGSSVTIIGISVAWCIALMSSNIFAIQEKNNLDRLYGSVSISLKEIVLGRYIFMVSGHIASFVLAVILYIPLALFHNQALNPAEVFFGFSISFLVFSVITGMEIPLFFKVGYTKAKVWFMLIFVVILALVFVPFLIPTLSGVINPILSNRTLLIIAGILIGCIIQYVSYRISVTAYRKRI